MGLTLNSLKLDNFLQSSENHVKEAMYATGKKAALELESAAKSSAPWLDRTGRARRSLTGECTIDGNMLIISLYGKEKHSVLLELCKEQKFSILAPAIYKNYENILHKITASAFNP